MIEDRLAPLNEALHLGFAPALQGVEVGPGVEDAVLRADQDHAFDGAVIGDGLDVPVEFRQRFDVKDVRARIGLVEAQHAELAVYNFAGDVGHGRSSQSAPPCPPPTQSETRARRPWRRCNSLSAVRTRRAPVAPTG